MTDKNTMSDEDASPELQALVRQAIDTLDQACSTLEHRHSSKPMPNITRRSEPAIKAPSRNSHQALEDTTTKQSTAEEQLDWLQNAIQEIGKMCLHLASRRVSAPSENKDDTSGPPLLLDPKRPATSSSFGGNSSNVTNAVKLSDYLRSVHDLTPEERLVVVDAAITMLSQVYVHLPLKRAMHGIDPIQRIRLLRQRLVGQLMRHEAEESARSFHDEMIEIFHSLRDLHTNYVLPAAYAGRIAFLPFLVEEYYEGNPPKRHYVVTRLQPGFAHHSFKLGVTVTHWNGIPIDRAVELNAAREAGSNADARHARGLEALTLRPMALTAPPDEEWVIIGYETEGQSLEVRFQWQVMIPPSSASGADVNDSFGLVGDAARVMGFDAVTETVRRAKKSLFFPEAMSKEFRMAQVMANVSVAAGLATAIPLVGGAFPQASSTDPNEESLRRAKHVVRCPDMATAQKNIKSAATAAGVASSGRVQESPEATSLLPDLFTFRKVTTPSGEFGYIRIYSFMTFDPNGFVAEFVRIAKLLPQPGLIIDVRGNGGGNINAGEQLLQVLTSKPIEPERFHFINTDTTLTLCKSEPSLALWVESLDLAVQTGETYSQGFFLTPIQMANNKMDYHYPGKIVLVIDALCYSTTDIFTAGFQDHNLGAIVGTHSRTGAGGANVWTYDFFTRLPTFPPLPKGVSFRSAIRRSTRIGPRAGVPLEDLGVQADTIHRTTRTDVLQDNADLINAAAEHLVS